MDAITSDVLGQENVAWFTHVLKNWIGFGYLGENARYVVYIFGLLLMLLILSQAIYLSIFCVMYICSFLLYIYKKMNNIVQDASTEAWATPRGWLKSALDILGKKWHGYEVIGIEHIPEGPGVIVYYHGAFVVDYMFFVARLHTLTGRHIYSIADNGLYLLPGLRPVLDIFHCLKGNKDECVKILKKGHLLGVAPGGLREGNFSDENYNLVWGKRTGFAQVALQAKVPIIPMFTQNLREAYRTYGKISPLKWLYEKTRMLILPIYGGFPVKFRTYIGEPIPYDPDITAKELAEKTKIALENIRNRYQKRPGNILRALLERFDKYHKEN
ncbi:monoacylglycerol/Diacylglycerol O-acyltransferase [Zootoca vivipara]|uniref:monoacylglycerol/Diacylglycerol O-acyltransferase n=1 Tax=Zootoca vivipara TaxID=8524 RepID=UPI00158FED4A|nr:monoacylglycerol/Diacylglycerol O-acyltransferase [Zootoca vivipara]